MDCKEFKEKLKNLIEEHLAEVNVFFVEADNIMDTLNIECDDGEWFAIHVTDLWSGEDC